MKNDKYSWKYHGEFLFSSLQYWSNRHVLPATPPPPDLFLFSQAQIPQDTEHYSRGFNMEKKGWEMLL